MTTAASQQAHAGEPPVSVRGSLIGLHGRFLVNARHNAFLSDTKTTSGGPGEALQAGELLLAALVSCSLGIIQRQAKALDVPLPHAEVVVSSKRSVEDTTGYEYIRLDIKLPGIDRPVAEALVAKFTDTCPIYNTLRRGGNVEVVIDTATA